MLSKTRGKNASPLMSNSISLLARQASLIGGPQPRAERDRTGETRGGVAVLPDCARWHCADKYGPAGTRANALESCGPVYRIAGQRLRAFHSAPEWNRRAGASR